jgi:hypothetical protein
LMPPSVLLTGMADVTVDLFTGVIYDTVKRFKRRLDIHLTGILIHNNIHDTTGGIAVKRQRVQ